MSFKEWLEQHGCDVEVTQEDVGSGFVCLEIVTRERLRFDVTVNT